MVEVADAGPYQPIQAAARAAGHGAAARAAGRGQAAVGDPRRRRLDAPRRAPISPPSPRPTSCRSPLPSAARTCSTTCIRTMPATSASASIRNWPSACATGRSAARRRRAAGRDDDRRLHADRHAGAASSPWSMSIPAPRSSAGSISRRWPSMPACRLRRGGPRAGAGRHQPPGRRRPTAAHADYLA